MSKYPSVKKFAEGLIEFLSKNLDSDTLKEITTEIVEKSESRQLEQEIVYKLRAWVEELYSLKEGSLINSFSSKISKLTSPKTVWLIVSLKIFDEDRPRVVELIGGGLTRQAIYKYVKYYNELDPRLEEHKQIKQNIELILKTYERKLV